MSPFSYNDHTLDNNLPALQVQPADEPLRQPPISNIGALAVLPLELVWEVVSELDIQTLMEFRRVNRRARELVDSLPEFKAIITHARNALHGILSIDTGRWITCRTLYEKLCRRDCEQCGDIGGYLYLLTCKRVCYPCFTNKTAFLPLRPTYASRFFALPREVFKTLPSMRAVTGTYSKQGKDVPRRAVLVDYMSAFTAALERYGDFERIRRAVRRMETRDLWAYDWRTGPWASIPYNRAVHRLGRAGRRNPLQLLHGQRTAEPFRYVAIVRVPWFDASTQEADFGFYCVGCRGSVRWPFHFGRVYDALSFDDHLWQCGDIVDGRHTPE